MNKKRSMISSMKRISPATFFALLLLLAGCSAQEMASPEGEASPVSFSLPGVESVDVTTTRAAENLPKGATVRVVAYTSNVPSASTYARENTYEVQADGSLVPCVTDDNGKKITGTATKLYLKSGSYYFFAVTPALKVDGSCQMQVKNKMDFATSMTSTATSVTSNTLLTVPLPQLNRQCSKLTFKVGVAKGLPVTNISIDGVVLTNLTKEPQTATSYNPLLITADTPINDWIKVEEGFGWEADLGDGSPRRAIGSIVVLPKKAGSLKIDLNMRLNNAGTITQYVALNVPTTFSPGYEYIFTMTLEKSGIVGLLLIETSWNTNDYLTTVGDEGGVGTLFGHWGDITYDPIMGSDAGDSENK